MNELPPKIQTPDSARKIENLKIKILVAEDDKGLQEFYFDILSGAMGYTVEIVKSGEALLEKLANNSYNLVITDNNMIPGGITGLQALEQIRANEKLNNLSKLPIIVCSGDVIKKSVEEKDAVFLSKSSTLTWGHIEKTVERVLAEARDQKIKDKLLVLYQSESFEKVHSDIVERSKYLERKYENLRDYTVFHALAGSSIRGAHPNLIENDLPGSDSIEKFVGTLEEKYKK